MNVSRHPMLFAARRRLVLAGAVALAPVPSWALSRLDSRGRYRLSADFAAALDTVVSVPFDVTAFQSGSDLALQPDGKVLVKTSGLYEVSLSIDWDLKAGRDIALRQTGIRRQRVGQPDEPLEAHERVLYGDLPGADSPEPARAQVAWSPPSIARGAVVTLDVPVTPTGTVKPGDLALASHSQIKRGALPANALDALIVQAKVIDVDLVRVSLYNPSVGEGISIPAGTLNVVAMSATRLSGGSGDGWHPLHSPSVVLEAGDKLYATVRHHVAGSLVQATKMSFLQVDRLE